MSAVPVDKQSINHGGIFGKLPAHGDFILRNLPMSFTSPWDEWLQRAVHGSRETMGPPWLDYYLTSPIWRFALSSGVLDANIWIGILVPSVDSVGRYFPLTLTTMARPRRSLLSMYLTAQPWYEDLSELAITALQETLLVDQVLDGFPVMPDIPEARPVKNDRQGSLIYSSDQSIENSLGSILEHMYMQQSQSMSVWWCAGSQHMEPTTILARGLPDTSLYSRMLGAEHHDSYAMADAERR